MTYCEKADLQGFLPIKMGTVLNYTRGEVIYSPGHNQDLRIFVVQEGMVFLETCIGDKKVGLQVVRSGEVFGVEAVCGKYITSARCAEVTKVVSWYIEGLGHLMVRPGFCDALMCAAVDRIADLQLQVERFATMKAKERIEAFLVDMAVKFADEACKEEGMVCIPAFTHGDLANFIGTTREVVTHFMGELKEEGLIKFRRRGPIFVSSDFVEHMRALLASSVPVD